MSARPRTAASPGLLLLVALVAVATGAATVLVAWAQSGARTPTATVQVGAAAGDPARGWEPWDRNEDGRPVRWNPCEPIDLVVDPTGAYPGFREDLEDAVADVGDISGLTLRIVGEVDERPDARRPLHQPGRYGDRWAPVLVAFAHPGEGDLPLLETDRALASPVAVGVTGDRLYVTGQVVLNVERDDLEAGAADRDGSWGATIRHELGHLLGLAHVDDEAELMHAHPVAGPLAWGDGDRRGLRAVGAGPCLEVPEPQHLEVELGAAG